jgi:predicted AlkP superfamily phosphohydrolase/phosphomutase
MKRLLASTSLGPFLFLVVCGAVLSGACRRAGGSRPLVVLIGLDGASLGVIDQLRADGRLPALDRVIRSGSWGLLGSVQSRQVADPRLRKGYFSPVIWTSIATGQGPEKHGVLDFALPRPGSSFVWAGGSGDPPRAELSLREVSGPGPLKLRLRLRSCEPNGAQEVVVLCDGQRLGTIEVPPEWRDFTLELPETGLRPVRRRIELLFSRQSRPADSGASPDRRLLAGALGPLQLLDAAGAVLLQFDPVLDRFDLGAGFHEPEAEFVEAQSGHWRARPMWDLLGERGHPAGIIGWWATWPAYEVHGFLISSHMGLRGHKGGQARLPHLTWPPELAASLEPLRPGEAELERLVGRLWPPGCMPGRPDRVATFRKVLEQDEFYFRIARRLLPEQTHGLLSVYFESTDVGGHHFLPLRDGAPLPEGCPESSRGIVDRIYEQVDLWLDELLQALPPEAVVLVLSDHGMVTLAGAGQHYPYGILAASGPGLRRGAQVHGASVLDVAPTVMHLFGAPIPLDMDGKLLVQLFEEEWLQAHPPRYTAPSGAAAPGATPRTEATDEMMERLRGIGYID